MKYLIQNRKEFAITVGFFIMSAVNLYRAIMSDNVTEDLIAIAIYEFLGFLAWFYNMPTSKENCEHTGQMRLEKEQNQGKITGENFTDEAEESPEREEEDA